MPRVKIPIKRLHYSIPVTDFKKRGYRFQKLFARNYKTYQKTIEGFDFWIWVKGQEIEIEDWYGRTLQIVKYFLDNIDNPNVVFFEQPYGKIEEHPYMSLHFDPRTGHIFPHQDIYNAIEKYFDELKSNGIEPQIDDWSTIEHPMTKGYHSIYLDIAKFSKVVDELKIISKEIRELT